ncbi:MAG TPA: hypothetical protein VLA39_10375 [Marinobacterium sp.]|nr:hypothetical protein [Marinobacterium sp.]
MEPGLFAFKNWITSALLSIGGSSGFWVADDSAHARLGEYVPADTVLYAGGSATSAVLAQLDYLYAQPDLEFDAESIAQEIETGSGHAPLQRFGAAVVRNLFSDGSDISDVYSRLGLSMNGNQEFYLDGLVPVLHITALEGERFEDFWALQARSAGLPVEQKSIAGHAYLSIQLTPPQERERVDLVVTQRGDTAVLSFVTPFDSAGELAQRLRIATPSESLQSAGTLAGLQQSYGFTRDFNLIIDIQQLAGAILNVQSTRMATDIKALAALLNEPAPSESMTQVCREEYARIASWIPRIVSGYTLVETEPELRIASRGVVEVAVGDTLQKLNLLNGHIPGHVADFDNQLFGFGLGIDMDQLLPVTIELWSQFIQQTFACAEIREAQQQISQTNPALLGLFTGMAQGVKGVGLSLYGLEFGDAAAPIKKLDMLLSVATQNPALLASLAAGSPLGAYGQIPLDGSSASVDLSELQPGLTAEVAVRGEYIALSTGTKSQQASANLRTEGLEPNGMMQMSFNYPAFADLIETFPVEYLQVDRSPEDASLCVERVRLASLLRQTPLRAGYSMGITPQGLNTSTVFALTEFVPVPPIEPVGRYQIFDHTFNCDRGERIGIENIKADGTGSYTETSADGRCEVYALEYRWSQTGDRLLFEGLSSKGRNNCSAEWESYGPYNSSCALIRAADGFTCLYDEDGYESLFKYRAIN